MAMDVGGAKGGVKSDINVTPLVDVMLVLLIIVMLIAPLLQQGVQLTLPTAVNAVPKPDTQDQIVVFVDAQSKMYVNTIEVTRQDLVARLVSTVEEAKSKVVYLKGDQNAPYSAIMEMMDALRKAKIETVALITEPIKGAAAEAPKGGM
jgi:biopolymer transport protein TolR